MSQIRRRISAVNFQSNILITDNGINVMCVGNGSPYDFIIEKIQGCLNILPVGALGQFAREFFVYYEKKHGKLTAKERKKATALIELFDALEEVEA